MSAARRLLGTAGGLGWLPTAPGTWTSLATVALCALLFGMKGMSGGLLASASQADARLLRGAVAGALLLLAWIGIVSGNHAERDFGREDPGEFVLDEVVGQGIALLPALPGPLHPGLALATFVLFRLFDVLKPPPCRRLEGLPGGLGIMADDVAAGAYAAAVVCGLLAVGWLPR